MTAIEARALIFDMDGLLIDSEPLWWSVEKALAARHGLVWTDEHAATCVGRGLPNTVETMRRALGLPLGIEEGVRALVDAFVARRAELVLKPGAREILAAAPVPCALATSNERRVAEAVIAELDLARAFSAVICGDEVARSKPAPDIFLCAAAELDIDGGAVVLEDSLAGVEAARAAGMVAIAVPERDAERFAELTPWVVGDLFEAAHLLRFDGA